MRRATVLGLSALLIAALIIFRDRLSADFWPLDHSTIGPNLLASAIQAVVVAIVAVLLYPPWRRAVHRFFDRKLDAVHDRIESVRTESREHREWAAQHIAELYEHHLGKPPAPHPHFDLKKPSPEGGDDVPSHPE